MMGWDGLVLLCYVIRFYIASEQIKMGTSTGTKGYSSSLRFQMLFHGNTEKTG